MSNRWLRLSGSAATVMCNQTLRKAGTMEYASIEREIHIDASPEVVFEVVSRPEHLSEWWPDEVDLEPTPGSVGHLVFGDRASGEAAGVPIPVLAAAPPRRFAFRWINPADQPATPQNSLLVTFDLE